VIEWDATARDDVVKVALPPPSEPVPTAVVPSMAVHGGIRRGGQLGRRPVLVDGLREDCRGARREAGIACVNHRDRLRSGRHRRFFQGCLPAAKRSGAEHGDSSGANWTGGLAIVAPWRFIEEKARMDRGSS
jgi:hypothetical protein